MGACSHAWVATGSCEMAFSDDPRIAAWEREKARVEANEPPPNHQNPPKRHHYVPEMYLARFAARSAPTSTPRVQRLDAKSGPASAIVIGVHDAAVETDFYTVETDDPRRAHEAEHIIGIFEQTAAYAFANLDRYGSDHVPDDIDRENLSLFMALQFVRGHDTADFQTQFYTKTTRMMMRVAAATPGYVRNYLLQQGEDASDDAVGKATRAFQRGAEHMSVTPHKNETVASMLQSAVEFMPYFFKRRWIIARSAAPFLTTDRPIVLLQWPDPNDFWRGVGLGTAETVVFALDRHRVLLMRHPDPRLTEGVVDIEDAFARRLNIAIANRARRWIFHHPDDRPLDGVPFRPTNVPKHRRTGQG